MEDLRPHYSRFLRPGRVLLTGHSHQAWPDVAEEGLLQCFQDAADQVDDKWGAAFEQANLVRRAIADRIAGTAASEMALGTSTHDLLFRLMSASTLRARPRIVMTSGEFHSLTRQLTRLVEEGIEVVIVPIGDVETLAERMAAALNERTALVFCSSVLFQTATLVPHLAQLTERANELGVWPVIDAYHQFNVVPMKLADFGVDPVFITGGGYKYAQWGEGVCFLRIPPELTLRPAFTGWFANFSALSNADNTRVSYGKSGADAFMGSTYDPISHYRAARVAEFFDEEKLTVAALREKSLEQTSLILERLADFEVLTPTAASARGGFVAVRVPDGDGIVAALRREGIFTDARSNILRFGPAPYTTHDEISGALDVFTKLMRS